MSGVDDRRGVVGIWSVIVAALFGLFYAYDLWEAISNLVALPGFYEYAGFGVENVPWWLLVVGVAIPVVVFVLALLASRGRSLLIAAAALLVGLTLVSALGLGVVGLEDVLRPTIVLVPR